MPCYSPFKLGEGKPRVSCGKCIGCLLENSRQWAVRCVHEAQMHEVNCFATLTYRDENLVFGKEGATLFPRHLELFWKKLRKEFGNGIRYFAAGEYGEERGRPHYHACIFGHDFPDKKFLRVEGGNSYFTSDALNRLWSHGDCILGELTFESAAYVARYVIKKRENLSHDKNHYANLGIHPEFARMSRGSKKIGTKGIGSSWYEKYKSDIYPEGTLINRGIKMSPPRYYANKFKKSNLEEFENLKILRRSKLKLSEQLPKRLIIKQTVKISQIKSLAKNKL